MYVCMFAGRSAISASRVCSTPSNKILALTKTMVGDIGGDSGDYCKVSDDSYDDLRG